MIIRDLVASPCIRRFQNADGSLTGAGRKRYGVIDKTREKISGAVSRHKEKQLKQAKALEDAYVSKGMSREKAAKKVETRRKIERALMIAGAVAVTAAVGTYAYRKYQGQVDHILKQGTPKKFSRGHVYGTFLIW